MSLKYSHGNGFGEGRFGILGVRVVLIKAAVQRRTKDLGDGDLALQELLGQGLSSLVIRREGGKSCCH